MVAYDKPDIDSSQFPESDGEPMAETTVTMIQMVQHRAHSGQSK